MKVDDDVKGEKMKQGAKTHIASRLPKAEAEVEETAGEIANPPAVELKGKAKSRVRKTKQKVGQPVEVLDGAAAPRTIRLVASESLKPPATMAAKVARWPRSFGAWSKAFLFAVLRTTRRFFSYLGKAILSVAVSTLYKQRSPRAA